MSDPANANAAKIAAMTLAQLGPLCAAAGVGSIPARARRRPARRLEAADQAVVEAAIQAMENAAGDPPTRTPTLPSSAIGPCR